MAKPAAIFFAIICTATKAAGQQPIVDLGYAKYLGHHNDTFNVNNYHGIPFAAPPTGPLRWKAPQPYTAPNNLTDSPVDATRPGAACVQGIPYWIAPGPIPVSGFEDCLILDVITPGDATEESKLPVLVSIHGGGYTLGDAGQASPYALMRHSDNAFIFVNIQYRLGAFGFMGGKKFVEEGGTQNLGLLDQRMALEWVQKNIEAFGGDAKKVTILGGSAGGGSVTAMLAWKGGVENPPFRAAVADFPYWQQHLREEQLNEQFDRLLNATNCSDLACLQALPENVLKDASQATYTNAYLEGAYGFGHYYYGPYVDGELLRDLPSREYKSGNFAKVPLWLSREGYEGVTATNTSLTTVEEEKADLRIQFPYASQEFMDSIYKLWPSEEYNSTFYHRATWFGDFVINCPTYYVGTSVAAEKTTVYKMIFNTGTKLHGSTGPFLMDLDYASQPGANVTVADSLKDWYISFAIHADPNHQSWSNVSKPLWEDYATGQVLSINDTEIGSVGDEYYDATERCQFFWDNGETVQH
ncbi:alpha/beta-hydrolase [Periconia macrospinosa]|uniref:Carboxylic ester hydrolase n=1 Tax=Periconia macrospinosa TaxID=97972 RepID=A0A2V1E660_9PLEO|nr:alpha/beta-hydrolase [Periconia macrospinosa]